MKIGIALVVLLASHAQAEPQDNTPKFIGDAGAVRCDEWSEARDQKTPVVNFGLEGWVLGFVSGANLLEEGHDLLLNVSEKDVFTRVDFYCREHASNVLFQAAGAATADLLRTRAMAIRRHLEGR
jgi:hypothetical protein